MTVRRYDANDPRGAIEEVLSALGGGREFEERLAALTALDERACDELFDALLTSGRSWPGRPGAHLRDVEEERWFVLAAAARAWPRRFLELTLASPAVHGNLGVISALSEVDSPEAGDILVAAARDRRAGRQFHRFVALQSLIRRQDPRLPDLLVDLVRDRAQLVQALAVEAARQHGDARLLPHLRRIAAAPKTPPGTRDDAQRAIEAIERRQRRTRPSPATG